jgi:hypothetical protein
MASPAAAGAALLIRQYFVDTYQQFNLAVCISWYKFCKSFEPSGVLVKAILLHAGNPMTVYDSGNKVVLKTPPGMLS